MPLKICSEFTKVVAMHWLLKRILNSSVQPMPSLEMCVLLIAQEGAIPVTLCDWSTTIADSCPWIIPMSLMCESFKNISLCVNIQYSVNVLGYLVYGAPYMC